MKYLVYEPSFWELFPTAEIGILSVDNVRPSSDISPELQKRAASLLAHANSTAQKWVPEPTISQNEVVAIWRDAYRKFKTKGGARCSVENLLKRILKDNPVSSIAPSVDVSNAISLKYALPIGVENLDAIQGNLRVAITQGGDPFLPIGSDEQEPTLPGELAYLDDAGAVCRCWNWRDGQRTQVDDTTPHCIFAMENLDPARSADLHAAIDELQTLVEEILGATTCYKGYITKDNPQVQIA